MLSMLTWLLRQAADVAAELGLSFSQWEPFAHMRLLELNDAIRPQQSRQIKHLGPRAPLFMSFCFKDLREIREQRADKEASPYLHTNSSDRTQQKGAHLLRDQRHCG